MPTTKPKYDVHPGVAMMRKWADELPAKTGRSLDEWAELVRRSKLTERKDRVALLKDQHHAGVRGGETGDADATGVVVRARRGAVKGILKPNPRANGNDRLRHQVHLATVADVTPEVLKWLKAAYDADA